MPCSIKVVNHVQFILLSQIGNLTLVLETLNAVTSRTEPHQSRTVIEGNERLTQSSAPPL